MLGGDGEHGDAEAGELVRERVVVGPVALVGGDGAGHARLAHALEHLLVERRHARARVHHHHAHGRVGHGHGGLLARLGGEGVLASRRAVEGEPARVHEQEALAVRLHLARHAVARDAGLVEHDGDALPRDAVEERALAHVRAADDRDDASGAGCGCLLHVRTPVSCRGRREAPRCPAQAGRKWRRSRRRHAGSAAAAGRCSCRRRLK